MEEKIMKKIVKAISLSLAVVMLALTLTACGSNSSAGLSKLFTCGSSNYLDGIGWYASDVVTLKVNSADTYELTFQEHIFGTTDPGVKGMRTVIYTGKCSSAPSSDGWETHVDYTLEPATHIYMEQHEKGYGRSPALAGHLVLDTDNWTDTMTQIFDPEGNTKTIPTW